jgi:hypothetical protein
MDRLKPVPTSLSLPACANQPVPTRPPLPPPCLRSVWRRIGGRLRNSLRDDRRERCQMGCGGFPHLKDEGHPPLSVFRPGPRAGGKNLGHPPRLPRGSLVRNSSKQLTGAQRCVRGFSAPASPTLGFCDGSGMESQRSSETGFVEQIGKLPVETAHWALSFPIYRYSPRVE